MLLFPATRTTVPSPWAVVNTTVLFPLMRRVPRPIATAFSLSSQPFPWIHPFSSKPLHLVPKTASFVTTRFADTVHRLTTRNKPNSLRCSFMTFAKNKNSLESEELRPQRLLTGGEWECPQCEFFNFSRNVVCLRCDCKKPEVSSLQSPTTVTGLGADISSVTLTTERPIDKSEGEQQQWLTKITELEKSSDLNSSVTDEDFSIFMNSGNHRVSSGTSNIHGIPDDVNPKPSGTDSNINADNSQNVGELLAQKSQISITDKDGDYSESRSDAIPSDTSNSTSQYGILTNEDVPEIMPIRSGETHFVVSKKKDRSLTSPMYKKRVAIEQAGSSNHVPFVPFPPGYFTQDKPDPRHTAPKSDTSGGSRIANDNSSNNLTVANQPTGAMNSVPGKTGERNEASKNLGNTSQFRSSNDGYSKTEKDKSSVEDMSWRGRSLEGSAVKKPDMLDMSEEAKSERWFRRVAQIKDISELTQIPDEDFPSIMPLRKGVNRFVVSKRKTPLERRLTSSQYRKDLPAVNSEPDHVWNKTESS